ncbi:MAG: hypothetical protein ACOVMQ_03380 [Cyclobacteriaceae bacterium]|jgi:hypothetical protein
METVTIELLNEKAYGLLKDLEDLHLIRLVENDHKSNTSLSDQFEGKLSNEAADSMRKHVEQVRQEWDRGI